MQPIEHQERYDLLVRCGIDSSFGRMVSRVLVFLLLFQPVYVALGAELDEGEASSEQVAASDAQDTDSVEQETERSDQGAGNGGQTVTSERKIDIEAEGISDADNDVEQLNNDEGSVEALDEIEDDEDATQVVTRGVDDSDEALDAGEGGEPVAEEPVSDEARIEPQDEAEATNAALGAEGDVVEQGDESDTPQPEGNGDESFQEDEQEGEELAADEIGTEPGDAEPTDAGGDAGADEVGGGANTNTNTTTDSEDDTSADASAEGDAGDTDVAAGATETSSAVADEVSVADTGEETGDAEESGAQTESAPDEVRDSVSQTAESGAPEAPITQHAAGNDYTFGEGDCTLVADGEFYCVAPTTKRFVEGDPRVYAELDREGDREIYHFDGVEVTRITNNSYDDYAPVFDEAAGVIVWQANVQDRLQVFYHNLAENVTRQITTSRQNSSNPDIEGDRIVWQEWVATNWEVFLAEVEPDGVKIEQLTDNGIHDMFPQVYDGLVTWQREKGSSWEVIVHNLKTGEEYAVEKDEDTKYENPRFVLLFDSKHDNGDVETIGYDLDTGEMMELGTRSRPIPADPVTPKDEAPDAIPREGGTQSVKVGREDGDDDGGAGGDGVAATSGGGDGTTQARGAGFTPTPEQVIHSGSAVETGDSGTQTRTGGAQTVDLSAGARTAAPAVPSTSAS